MKVYIPAMLCALALVGGSASVRAEVDRTKKEDEEANKARPELDVDHEGESHHEFHERLAREGEDNLKEIQRLLDEVNNNLAKQNTGSETQTKQQEAVKKMRSLIEELSKGCRQCQSGGQGQSSQQPQQGQQKKQQGGKQQQQGEKREGQKQVKSGKQKQEQDEQGRREDNRRNVPNNRVAEDKLPESGKGRLGESGGNADRWGFLPPKLREEMFSAGAKDPPSEYGQIVERYYKRISDYYERRKRP